MASIGSSLASAVGITANEKAAKYTELVNSTVNNAIENTTNHVSSHKEDTQRNLEDRFEITAQNTVQNAQNNTKNLTFSGVPTPGTFPSTPVNNNNQNGVNVGNLQLQFPTSPNDGSNSHQQQNQFGECSLFCSVRYLFEAIQ